MQTCISAGKWMATCLHLLFGVAIPRIHIDCDITSGQLAAFILCINHDTK